MLNCVAPLQSAAAVYDLPWFFVVAITRLLQSLAEIGEDGGAEGTLPPLIWQTHLLVAMRVENHSPSPASRPW